MPQHCENSINVFVFCIVYLLTSFRPQSLQSALSQLLELTHLQRKNTLRVKIKRLCKRLTLLDKKTLLKISAAAHGLPRAGDQCVREKAGEKLFTYFRSLTISLFKRILSGFFQLLLQKLASVLLLCSENKNNVT